MSKRKAASIMTAGEQVAGTVLFLLYLVVLPFVTTPLFDFCERIVGAGISPALRSGIYYCVLFVACIVIFHRYLGRTSTKLADNLGGSCQALLMGLVGMYGLNELVYRLSNLVIANHTNLNDNTISAQIDDAPRLTLVIIIFIAPFVEEVLFRGLVFGNLKGKSLAVGYVLSCLLFALSHVWEFIIVEQSISQFLLMVKYLVPGFMLAWVYDRSGTLWTSIALHAAVNALALWT